MPKPPAAAATSILLPLAPATTGLPGSHQPPDPAACTATVLAPPTGFDAAGATAAATAAGAVLLPLPALAVATTAVGPAL